MDNKNIEVPLLSQSAQLCHGEGSTLKFSPSLFVLVVLALYNFSTQQVYKFYKHPHNYNNMYLGATAVCPVKSSEMATVGSSIDLRVYADADPTLQCNEVRWTRPNGETIAGDQPRFFLDDCGKQLRIESVRLQDNGTYLIEIYRMITATTSSVLASTTIELTVICKYL